MRRIFYLISMSLICLSFFSCGDSITYPDSRSNPSPVDTTGNGDDSLPQPPHNIQDTVQLSLVFESWNPSGADPHIAIDTASTSDEITVGPNLNRVPPVIAGTDVTFQLEDIALGYPPVLSRFLRVWSEELISGIWRETSEFPVWPEEITRLDVALVLDASYSLGSDFVRVQEYARQFVETVTFNLPKTRLAVIGFASSIDSLRLTEDADTAKHFIDNLPRGQYTALYEAMNTGITLLRRGDAHSRALVTFTDGNDNYSHPAITRESLIERLRDGGNAFPPKIRSFTIGFNGRDGVDMEALDALAVNNGQAVYSHSIDRIGELFNTIAREISTTVNFRYQRNNLPIPESDRRRVRFNILLEQSR